MKKFLIFVWAALFISVTPLFAQYQGPWLKAADINTSPEIAAILGDETGTGVIPFSSGASVTNWTMVTPTVTGTLGFSTDTFLVRDAADVIAQRDGTTAQTFRIYQNYTDASNYERLIFNSTSTAPGVFFQKAGTGSDRTLFFQNDTATGILAFGSNGTARWTVSASGHLLAFADNTYDIGAAGATRPRNVYVAGNGNFGGSMTIAASGGYHFGSNGSLRSASDGVFGLYNNAAADFNRVQLGGTTAAFSSIARDTTGVSIKLADASAPSFLRATRNVQTKTGNYVVLNTESRDLFTNLGASAGITYTLPAGLAGLSYTFIVEDADGITVAGNGAQQIRVAAAISTATTGNISSTTIGDSVTLTWTGTSWHATSTVGTWTVL